MNGTLTADNTFIYNRLHNDMCLYYHFSDRRCRASLFSMVLTAGKMKKICGTEYHDNCPVFLSKILRKK